ncbi:unnamed protein product [Prorocentrum cordatum]|uniref:Uncharacterized protein n=1 Tax=Prorocentrum cordatum TaxID=2364126 RepID=A0ABN9T627_9DINO|nr:unnamed protein product [Polarella glacialis]
MRPLLRVVEQRMPPPSSGRSANTPRTTRMQQAPNKSFYHNRPGVRKSNGYRNADGSFKSPAALQRSLKIHRANGKLGGGAPRTAARRLRERQSRGGRRSGFRAAFGVLKFEAAIAKIRRLSSKARSASGPCKQLFCVKCGAGNRVAVYLSTGRGCHKFVPA